MKQKLEPLFIKFEIFKINQQLNFEIAKFIHVFVSKEQVIAII